MTKKRKPTPTKRPARKRTSDDISSAAATLLNKCPKKGVVSVSFGIFKGGQCIVPLCKAKLLRSLLASLVGQDETKGRREGRVKR